MREVSQTIGGLSIFGFRINRLASAARSSVSIISLILLRHRGAQTTLRIDSPTLHWSIHAPNRLQLLGTSPDFYPNRANLGRNRRHLARSGPMSADIGRSRLTLANFGPNSLTFGATSTSIGQFAGTPPNLARYRDNRGQLRRRWPEFGRVVPRIGQFRPNIGPAHRASLDRNRPSWG